MIKNYLKILPVVLIAISISLVHATPIHARPYEDVDATQWFAPFVYELVQQKVLDSSKTKYYPADYINRAQALKLLLETNQIETHNTPKSVFGDVPNDAWFKKYVMAAYTKGIIQGKSKNIFGPGDFITRAEFAQILVKIKKFPDSTACKHEFPDLKNHFAKESLMMLYCFSIAEGYPDGTMGADRFISRGEIAKIIVNAANPVERLNVFTPGDFNTGLYSYSTVDFTSSSKNFDQQLIRTNKKDNSKQVIIASIQNVLKEFLEKYAEPDDSHIVIFKSYLPETDNPTGAFYSFDTSTNQFTFMKANAILAGAFGWKDASADQTKLVWIPEEENEGLQQKMFLIDLTKDTYKILVQLSSNETFNQGNFALSSSYDLKWVNDHTLQYAVYDQLKKKTDDDTSSFIEYRQVSLE